MLPETGAVGMHRRGNMKTIFLFEFIIFYIFFFARAKALSTEIGKNIKAKDPLLDVTIIFAGLSALSFIIGEYIHPAQAFLLVLFIDNSFDYIGLVFITLGLVLSVLSSLNLGKSWRIGVNSSDKTELVTSGFYSRSRNPYFTAHDFVLIGAMIASGSVVVSFFSILTIVLFHLLILKEEKYLEEIHKEGYLAYKKKVRRYL